MSLFRCTVDGNLLSDEPEGLMDFVSELKRDKEIKGQVLLVDLTLKFNGGTDGYIHLKPLIDCQGFCSFSEITIDEDCNEDGNWVQIFEGILDYTEVREHLFPCVLECQLMDNSYFAKIDRNKNIEAYINVDRSKNDEEIFAVFAGTPIGFFDVVSGTYTGTVECWWVNNAFRFIIEYMTDGEMGFVSDYFSTGGGSQMWITLGERIRLQTGGSTLQPFFSFQKLFEEVNKKTPLGFSIETIAGVKTMRIEPKGYFFNTGISTTLNDVKGIIKSVNTAELFSRLKIGSSESLPYVAGSTDFPNDIKFLGTQEESYTVTGRCNVDTTLDLVSEWIIDTNVIQDVFSNGNSGYDENIFFIMTDGVNAIQTDVLNTGAPPFFYNDFFRNANVAFRWLGGIPNTIALYLGPAGNNEFQAAKTTTQFTNTVTTSPAFEPVTFENDFTPPNNDPGANYSVVTSEYDVPATGYFTFFSLLQGVYTFNDTNNQFGGPVELKGYIQVYDSLGFAGGNLLASHNIFDFTEFALHGDPVPYNLSGSAFIPVVAGNKVLVMFEVLPLLTSDSYVGITVTPGSLFACVNSATSGGNYQTYNPEDFKAYQYEFKNYPLTFAQYQTIIANPLKLLGANDISGWIENMKYRHVRGTADFILSKSLPKNCE